MLTKFDSKSNRVKGLSFHPKRPWILASLHNGVIQLWDYRMGTLLDRFEEHEGPVRGIDFHKSQPLFVSGGDDYKIKVWNYKTRRCLFTLLGHLDYIRTVQFHHEYPWIVSASDDQTIRLWNWQSRNCISVLTGHNHYVMSAQFHPREDMIVSASLDQTVRVWDTSGLRRKTVRGAPGSEDSLASMRGVNAELFATSDAVVKYVLEGHDRGVNWASFHPTKNFIVSGADDKTVRLWGMNESRAWELEGMKGHTNNVSCVMFHPKHELVISNSEDRSIRVWDTQKRTCLQTFRREADRFWMLAVHPEQNVIAAGHDNGMLVFKLERERPAYAVLGEHLYYVKDRYLRRATVGAVGGGAAADVPVLALRQRSSAVLGSAPRALIANTFNPTEVNLLMMSPVEGGSYELYQLNQPSESDPQRGQAIAAVFTARNKYATLDKTRTILVKGLSASDPGKRVKPPYPNADMLFPSATSGRLLVRAEDRVCLFELQSRKVVAEIAGVVVKYVCWSADGSHVALMGKHAVVLADKELTQVCSVTETVRVKSGGWDENGVFIYTTLNHVKYLLPTTAGESGIVRTLDQPVYVTEVKAGQLYALDRDAKHRAFPVDATEHLFKLALSRRQFERVLQIIKSARLCGQAVIAFLQKAGYPEIALLFVEDDQTRFNLALQCKNLDIALAAAKALNSEEAWHRLAREALEQGQVDIAEQALQTVRALDKLSFLYTVSGNRDKLGKMLAVAQARNDTQARFHNALYLGDAAERVRVLESAGQTALAYATAASHGLAEDAERLKGYLEAAGLPVPQLKATSRPLVPLAPTAVVTGSLPRAASGKAPGLDLAAIAAAAANLDAGGAATSGADKAAAAAAAAVAAAQAAAAAEAEERRRAAAAAAAEADEEGEGEGEGEAGWGDDLDLGFDEPAAKKPSKEKGGGWGDDDLDLGLDDADTAAAAAAPTAGGAGGGAGAGGGRGDVWSAPAGGTAVPAMWVTNSSIAADHVAAGSYDSAMSLLNRQLGLVNFAPMKPHFTSVLLSARTAVSTLPGLTPMPVYLSRSELDAAPPRDKTLPLTPLGLPQLSARIKHVYDCFTDGKFSEARDTLDALFAMLPLAVVHRKEDVAEVKAILKAATQYKLAVRIMLTARAHDQADGPRQMELAAYMTHCELQPAHLLLALNLAMSVCFKFQNFILAAGFARRLIELPEAASAKNATTLTKAKRVLELSEKQGRNAVKIAYDDRAGFDICAASLTPIAKGSPVLFSPYSGAAYTPSYKGSVCVVDNMACVGLETLGLVCSSVQARTK